MPFKICSAADSIVEGQISGSFLIDNVWHIYTKNNAARNDLLKHGMFEIDQQKVELYDVHPAISNSCPSEKIVFRNVPPSIHNNTLLQFLDDQPGVIIKSKVVSGKIRNERNELTNYYSGERIVYVKGDFSPVLPMYTDIGTHKIRVWHSAQYDACKRCRHIDHGYLETDKCNAYLHDDDVIAFRSPNYVLCNFYEAKFFVYNSYFTSVEQAYQWRKMKHIGQEAYALEISKSKTPGRAKQIANRVPGNLLKDWHVIKCDVMRELLIAKVEQCSKFRSTLLKTEGKRLIEATNDMYWASGLPPYLSTTTKPECFPGKNWLGRILEDIRDELRQSTSSSSMDTSDSTNTLIGEASRSTTDQPPVSTTAQPPVSTNAQPPVSTTAQPPVSTPAQSPVSTTAQLPVSTTSQPPVSTTAQPPVSTTAQPPVSTPAQSPVSTTAQPPVSTPAQSLVSTTAQPPVSTTALPTVVTTAQPPVSTTAQPPVSTTAQSLVSTTAQLPVSTTAQPPVSTTALPTVVTTAQPPVLATAQPPVSTTAQPTVVTTAQPSVLTTAQPPVSTTALPTVVTTAQPPVLATAQPPVSTTAQPTVVTTAQPSVLTTAQPPVTTTDQPPVSTTELPLVLTTAQPPVSTTALTPMSTTGQPPVQYTVLPSVPTAAQSLMLAPDSPPVQSTTPPPVSTSDSPLVSTADSPIVCTTDVSSAPTLIHSTMNTISPVAIDSTETVINPELVIPPPFVPSNVNIESPTRTEKQLKIIENDIELIPKLLLEVNKTRQKERRKARSLLRDPNRARSSSVRSNVDMKPIDSYFVRKRKASGIATSPTSPDHEPADKIVKCFNEGELSHDIGSPPLSRTASEPALLDMENVAAPSDVSAMVDTSDVASAEIEDVAVS